MTLGKIDPSKENILKRGLEQSWLTNGVKEILSWKENHIRRQQSVTAPKPRMNAEPNEGGFKIKEREGEMIYTGN